MNKLLKMSQADMAVVINEMMEYLTDDDTCKQTDVVIEANLQGFRVRIEDLLESLQQATLREALRHPKGKELGFPKPDDYQSALYVLDACNLSGVVHSMSEVVRKIWNEANAMEIGTPYVNTHPLVVLYATKVAQLAGITGQPDDVLQQVFGKAYDMCKVRAAVSEKMLERITWEYVKPPEKRQAGNEGHRIFGMVEEDHAEKGRMLSLVRR